MKQIEMSELQLRTCEALQRDITVLGGQEWEINEVYNMWLEWCELCSAQWLNYTEGDTSTLVQVIYCLTEIFEEKEKEDQMWEHYWRMRALLD